VLLPFAARAQPQRHRIAWLGMAEKSTGAVWINPFLEGMAALGYVQGRNFELDERWGENSRETLERLALEAAALKPAVFVSQGPAVHVARKLPGTTPVVFGTSGDPVEIGVARSIARPGGHFTGITFLAYELVGKRVELLHQVAPRRRPACDSRSRTIRRPTRPSSSARWARSRRRAPKRSSCIRMRSWFSSARRSGASRSSSAFPPSPAGRRSPRPAAS
jgi:putative ABC transport system substrate-binding protein